MLAAGRLPRRARDSTALLTQLSARLLAEQRHTLAEKLLRERLDSHWDDALLPLYARMQLADAAKQLNHAESWLADHSGSAPLLLTLGQLCLRCQLWGKARAYIESSFGMQESPAAALALAELLTQLGEIDSARDYYARGLRLALNSTTATLVLTPVESGAMG